LLPPLIASLSWLKLAFCSDDKGQLIIVPRAPADTVVIASLRVNFLVFMVVLLNSGQISLFQIFKFNEYIAPGIQLHSIECNLLIVYLWLQTVNFPLIKRNNDVNFMEIRYDIRDLKISFSENGDVAWFYCVVEREMDYCSDAFFVCERIE
jgi:hypothetical protein